jgi:hypothetical protein
VSGTGDTCCLYFTGGGPADGQRFPDATAKAGGTPVEDVFCYPAISDLSADGVTTLYYTYRRDPAEGRSRDGCWVYHWTGELGACPET